MITYIGILNALIILYILQNSYTHKLVHYIIDFIKEKLSQYSSDPIVMQPENHVVSATPVVPVVPTVIVTYKGNQYNITDFIKRHPGGRKVLIENNGKDIEQLMIERGHSAHAYGLLEKYRIN